MLEQVWPLGLLSEGLFLSLLGQYWEHEAEHLQLLQVPGFFVAQIWELINDAAI